MRFIHITKAMGLAAALLAGCKHSVPETPFSNDTLCKFVRYELDLSHRLPYETWSGIQPVTAGGYSGGDEADSILPLSKAFVTSDVPKATTYKAAPYLFMSGGGPNGAFGAGILNGMANQSAQGDGPIRDGLPDGAIGSLPDFKVVTGISTGAILSIAAFSNTPSAAKEGYRIEDESEAITAFVTPDSDGNVPDSAMITALRKGALADLGPLMDSTRNIILDPQYCVAGAGKYAGCIMDRIARGHAAGRRMLTGVTDLETGQAVALDMGDMALRYVTARDYQERELRLNCFLKAIAASSSVPLAARPIAIDNRLYIDGGARFLLFGDILGQSIEKDRNYITPPNVYMIINGDQAISYKCGKKNPNDCATNPYSLMGGHKDWTLLSVIERTFDVLKTQVGEFSEAEVRLRAREIQAGGSRSRSGRQANALPDGPKPLTTYARQLDEPRILEPLKIRPENLENFAYHDVDWTNHVHSCAEWKEIDKATYRAIQFHKTYMRCLIAHGQVEGTKWRGLD